MKTKTAMIAALVISSNALASTTPPFHNPAKVSPVDIGFRHNILPPVHVHPDFIIDHPIVHPLLNMYEDDQKFANIFAENGSSEICGPAAMANALIYLKFNHMPIFPKILEHSAAANATNGSYVETLFHLCKTDKNTGTGIYDLRNCAIDSLTEGQYNTSNTYIRGIHSDHPIQKYAPNPGDLRLMSQSSYQPGASSIASDRGVVLLFGWYTVTLDPSTRKNIYQRVGGHYVTLAGYDNRNPNVFYVSNPLVNYNLPHFGDIRFSKITLERVPNQTNLVPPGEFKNLWQTQDLVGGSLAVLEDMVIILPLN